jgi:DNA-binding transcriptional LysR family regulator
MELSSCEEIKRTVAADLGVGIVSPQSIALKLEHELLAVVDEPVVRLRRLLYLITRKDALPSPAILAFTANVFKHVAAPPLAGG